MRSKLWKLAREWRDATTTAAAWVARDKLDVEFERLSQQEPMTEVADKYAHKLALELECVLADRPRYYDSAMRVLCQYRDAMNKIHEELCPTFMGEPLEHKHD